MPMDSNTVERKYPRSNKYLFVHHTHSLTHTDTPRPPQVHTSSLIHSLTLVVNRDSAHTAFSHVFRTVHAALDVTTVEEEAVCWRIQTDHT